MKKLLFLLLLLPTLLFGQATGKIIANRVSGGSIDSVNYVTLLNVNQTTVGQTLTVPNLTNASASKIIYINNVGSASFTLTPGGVLATGKGTILRWTGAAWNICASSGTEAGSTDTLKFMHKLYSVTETVTGNKTFSGSNAYGTPASITLTNGTGFPYATGGTGLLADGNISSASTWNAKAAYTDTLKFMHKLYSVTETVTGNKTFSGSNAYGTPASITLTNGTGFPYATGGTGLLADGNISSASTWNAKQDAVTATPPLYISSNVISAHKASATDSGYVSTGAQTFAGAKTFSSTISGSVNGNAATVTTNANLTGDVTSAGNATTLATVNSNVGSFTNGSFRVNEKGLITAASSGTAPVTSVSGTANQIASTGGTTPVLSIVNNAVLPGSPTIVSPGNSTQDIATVDATQTLTNKRVTSRTGTTTSSATPTINTDNVDYYSITALSTAITSFTTNLSGTPTTNQTLWIAITDNGTARALTWGASFEASGNIALPSTTVISTRLDIGYVWNEATSKWRICAVQ